MILNEVTSTNRSQLNGYTEVAGQRAEVIIANPNGITCNGCGFINTSRGVLTTGTPVMGAGGSLDAYRVTGGDIQIGASGLNGSNLDQLDLISRSLKVNGEIWANNLNAITGLNQVNHTDLGVQLITGDANKPTVGIDVALLGGMYANKIHLVGTEAGVGVSSAGALAAQAGDFSLDTQGQITLTGKTTSSGNLSLNSAAGISNTGTLDSRQNVQITAAGAIANSGALTAQNNLTLNAATLNSSGTLGAGINGNGNASQPGNITISTQNQATATGTNIAGGQIAINGSAINLGGSFTSAQQDINLTAGAGNIDLNNAQTQSLAGNVNLTANGTISNDNGLLLGTQVTATGTQLSNQYGQIGTQRIVMSGNLLDNSNGLIQANQLDFTLGNLTNRNGGIRQTGSQPLTAIIIGNALDNTGGWIQSDSDDFTLGANTLTNDNAGQIVHTGQGTLIVNATGALSNTGGLISSQGNASIGAGSLNNQGGVISVTGNGDIISQSTLDNSASGYIGATALTLTASNGAVNNTGGMIEAVTGLTLDAQSLTNSGGAIKVLSVADAQNTPTLLKITATQDIINNALNGVSGFIGSNGELAISSAALNNNGGKLYSNKNLVLTTSAALSNQSGFIQTDSDLSVTATGALNNQSGTLEANGASSLFSLTAASIDNTFGGRIANSGTGLTTINGGSRIDNEGTLGGRGDLTLSAGLLNNTTSNAWIQSGGTLNLNVSGTLNNDAGAIYAAQALQLNQTSANVNNTNGGEISSSGNSTINVATVNNAGGNILAGNSLSLTANSYTGAGLVAAGNSNTITLQGDFTYGSGNVFASDGDMAIAVTGTLTNTVVMQALGTLTIKAANINNQAAGHFNSNRTDLQATNGAITNYGTIEGNTVLTSSQTLNNYATIIGDIVALTVGDTLLNSGGNALLASTTQMNLWVNNLLHNTDGAEIFSMGDLNIAKDGTQDGAGNFTNLTSRVWNEGNSLSKSSLIEAWGNINIGAVNIDNLRQVGVVSMPAQTGITTLTTPRDYSALVGDGTGRSGSMSLPTGGNIFTVNSNPAPMQAGFFAQDIAGIDTVNRSFSVPGGDPISGSSTVYYENMSPTTVAATEYIGTTQDANGWNVSYTQVIKDSDVLYATYDPVASIPYMVVLKNGTSFQFNALSRQGQYYDVSYYPGYDPIVNLDPTQLNFSPAPSLKYFETSRKTTTSTVTEQFAAGQFKEARINSKGDINFNLSGVLTNQNSNISAINNIIISGVKTAPVAGGKPVTHSQVINAATRLNRVVTTDVTSSLGGWNPCGGSIIGTGGGWCWVTTTTITPPQTNSQVINPGNSAITAGGTISTHVGKSVNQATGSGTTIAGSTLANASVTTQVEPSTVAVIPRHTSGNIAPTSNITLPTNGLYSIRPQPDQQYLVVTDPRFANYKEFISSDYMLNRLTLDPTLTQKRLGDGFYEQRLINEQILDQTGRNVIGQYTSAEEQIKVLMDAGVAAAQALQLTPGISLSAEQVASLQHDIVWMEVNRVTLADGNSVEVLVPKLYLTQLHKNDLSPDGALMAASLIDINAEEGISNTGKIQSTIATRLQGKDIFNQGTLSSAGDMMLKADNDITNKSGTISANNLWLDAGRDLINTTATQTVSVGNASLGASNTLIGSTGTISASNNLSMKSGRDLTITGALVQAGGDARLSAGRNLYMNTLTAEASSDTHMGSFEYSTRQITNLASTIRTGGSLSMKSAADMQLTSAQLDIGQNALIAADGNLSVTAAKDSAKLDNSVDGGRNRGSIRTYDETVVGSSINANGNITLRAGSFANTGNARGGIERNGDPAQVGTGKVATEQHDDAEHIESSQERIASNNGSEVMLQPQITENRQLSIGLVEQKGLVVGIEPQIEGKPNMTVDEPGQPYENKPVAETKQAAVTETITQPAPQSGGNLTLQSVAINSTGGQVNLIAANDVNIGITEEMHDYFSASHTSSSGFLSKSSTTTRNENHQTLAVGSDISGESVLVKAGNAADKTGNINVIGGSIVGTNDVTLDAGNDLAIKAATSTSTSSRYSRTTESGLMSNGGLSISIGSRETTEKADSVNSLQSQNRSMVGSLNGNLNLKAGNKALISGSDILAGNDMNIAAMDITINSGLDDSTNTQSRDTKQSGLTLAITSNVTDAAQTAQQMKDAGSKSKDPRIKAMAAAAAALAAQNAASQGASASVSLTYGSSQSHSDSTQTSQQRSGSTLKAGGNLNLIATGGGENSNITIQGSDISAGQDTNLTADNKINLLADKNINDQVSHNSSSSSGAGVGITVGSGGGSFGITANASMARGNIDGTDTTYTNTHVTAGRALNIKSGGDTNMIGATASGKQITADIGGDLNIQSLQDTSTYDTKQQSASISGTYGAGVSANLSLNQSTINGTFASVQEQSGLMAGDGGFQIAVKGNTDLKGAVIESSQAAVDAGNNSLATATLTTSDIDNKSEYKAQSISVGAGTGGVSAPMALQAADKDTSTTRSGISGGAVKITDAAKQKQLTGQDAETTVASLNRDVVTGQDTSGAINNNLDVDQVQGAMAVTQAFVQQANTFMADMATKSERLKAAGDAKQTAADNEKDPARKAQLQAEANDLHQQSQDSAASSAEWAPGSTKRQILTAITAAAGGNVTGGTSQLVQGAAVNYIQSLGATEVKKIADSLKKDGQESPESESIRAALHGIVACAGASAQGSDCSSGALGASAGSAINSILQGDTSKMTAMEKENRKNLVATLVAGIAAAGGADIATATSAATFETENNRLLNQKETNKIAELAKNDPAKEQRLTDAACFKVHCSAQYPEGSQERQYYESVEARGQYNTTELQQLQDSQVSDAELFSYGTGDRFADVGTRAIGNATKVGEQVAGLGKGIANGAKETVLETGAIAYDAMQVATSVDETGQAQTQVDPVSNLGQAIEKDGVVNTAINAPINAMRGLNDAVRSAGQGDLEPLGEIAGGVAVPVAVGKLLPTTTSYVTAYRVEGIPNQRLSIDDGGNVSLVPGNNSTIWLNFGETNRAVDYFSRKVSQDLPGAQLKSFEIESAFLQQVQNSAVPEQFARQFPNNPIISADPFPNQFGIRQTQFQQLLDSIQQGTGTNGN
ncbi:hemagglutinin repeat-containing protein [Sideroxydans sp.]